jgi:hypothetical protein
LRASKEIVAQCQAPATGHDEAVTFVCHISLKGMMSQPTSSRPADGLTRWDGRGWQRSEDRTLAEACDFSAGLCTSLLERATRHLATVDHFALALKITWSTGGHEALVAQLKRYEKSMHRHASRAIPSRLCRYRSSFTFSGRSHSPRYIPPADSCVTEAA